MDNKNKNLHFYQDINVEWKDKKIKRKIAISAIVEDNVMKFGRAECSEKDTFDKKKGRIISEGRANKTPFHTINLSEEKYTGKRVTDIFIDYCKEVVKV